MAGEGASIPVPNVQALAASITDAASVPPRYVRPEAAEQPVAWDAETQLPVIDFSRLVDRRFAQEESAKLHAACEQWGFFQLINHQVPSQVIERVKADISEFFKLPLEEKMAFAQLQNGSLQGYGQAFVVSEEQKLDWGDMLLLMTRPLHSRNFRFWPSQSPSFRETLSSYSAEIARVARTLLEVMAKTLGITAPEKLLDVFQDLPQAVRINYYPPCPKAKEVFGLSPHTDATVGLTVLLQVNDVQGLQIKHDGEWFPVRPLPGAFIVNICDVLEVLSNGKYTSIEHRAMVDPEKERMSIAGFFFPREDAMIRPLPELMELQEGRCQVKYKEMRYRDFCKAFYSSKLDGKSHVESMKL